MKTKLFATNKTKTREFLARARRLATLGAALGALGCAAGVDDPLGAAGNSGESIAEETAPLTSCAPTFTTYEVRGGSATGPSTSTNICWATSFLETTTNFDPYMIVQHADGVWTASGWGQMMCVTQCAFNSNGGSADVRWLSPTFEAYKHAPAHTGALRAETPMWQGDAMNVLSGLHHFAGQMSLIDYGSTVWSSTSASTKLRAEPYGNAAASSIGVFGYSFFVGVPQSGHALRVSQEYTASTGGQTTMIGKDSGICAFTRLSRLGDSATAMMWRSSTNWKMLAGGHAMARCFYFDQSQ